MEKAAVTPSVVGFFRFRDEPPIYCARGNPLGMARARLVELTESSSLRDATLVVYAFDMYASTRGNIRTSLLVKHPRLLVLFARLVEHYVDLCSHRR